MDCRRYFAPSAGADTAFSVDVAATAFGPGVLAAAGDHARARGINRVVLMADKAVAGLSGLFQDALSYW